MKRFCRLTVSGCLSFLIISMYSCTEEIDLYPDGQPEQLFVWGCLDGSGVLHQIKIRKGITEEGQDVDLFTDPSNYLPTGSIEVSLSSEGDNPVYLKPVLYPPQSGSFAQDSNIIYEGYDYLPDPGKKVRLMIKNLETGAETTSEINLLRGLSFTYPVPEAVKASYDFNITDHPFHISWSGGSVSIWSISIKYLDILSNGDTIYRKGTFYSDYKDSSYPLREFALDYLYSIFTKVIPDDPDVDYRMFCRFDFGVRAGDYNLYRYLSLASKFSDNRKLTFNNISGGRGLLYSINHTELKNIRPKDKFANALFYSDSVKHLKFSRFIYDGYFFDPDSTASNPLNTCGL